MFKLLHIDSDILTWLHVKPAKHHAAKDSVIGGGRSTL